MENASVFQYRPPWRAGSSYPGSHPGMQRGGGYEVLGTAPLYAGDPRRFDIRASMRDPFGRLLVRIYRQRSIVPVYVLADVSASMGFVGNADRFALLIEFVESLAHSAYLVGDPFAFMACDGTIRDELSLYPTRARGAGADVCQRLRRHVPNGDSAAGLVAGAQRIAGTHGLVFLISDYYFPLTDLRRVLDQLSAHAVVPVVLIDSVEARIPGVGITHLYDPETGRRRTLLLRRAWSRRFEASVIAHRDALRHCLAEYDLRPLDIVDCFDAEAVSRYFYE